MAEIKITASGEVGCGKSAILGEIEILMKALGVPVRYEDAAAAQAEKNMTHADWTREIEMYQPSVVLVEELQAARRQHGSAAQAVGGDIAAGHFKPHPATREWQEVPRHTPGAVILYHAAGWPHAAAEPPAAAGNALTEALERVAAYIERRKKSRGLDIEHVHGFDLGPNEGVELLLSDIETIAAHTRAAGKDACVLGGGADGIHDPHFCKTHGVQFYGDACPGNKAMQAKSAQGGA